MKKGMMLMALVALLVLPMVSYAETAQECASNCVDKCSPLGSGKAYATCLENCLKGCYGKPTGIPDVPPPQPANPSRKKSEYNPSSISFAPGSDVQKNNWLLGTIIKFENMRNKAIADIQKYEGEIQKSENTISKSESIIKLAKQKGNVKAEEIAREASIKAQEARIKNMENKNLAELNKKRVENALASLKTGDKDLESKVEQVELENMYANWIKNQKQLIEQRLREPNQYISAIYKSLKTKAPPPLPPRKYDELQPGDVLLISPEAFWDGIKDGSFWINAGDRAYYRREIACFAHRSLS